MSRKPSQFLSKLWKKCAFRILQEPGKEESDYVFDNLQSIIAAYCDFQQKVMLNIKNLRSVKLNIPALVKIRDELARSRSRVQKFIRQETEIVSKALNYLGEFRFMLQKSQMNASKEYYDKINQFLNSKEDKLSQKKVQGIHQSLQKLNYSQKQKIRDSPSSSAYEKWLTSFYLKSQDFFRKAYGTEWQQEAQRKQMPFIQIKHEEKLNAICFPNSNQFSHGDESTEYSLFLKQAPKHQSDLKARVETKCKGSQPNLLNRKAPIEEKMDEEQNDIVSQIYKQLGR